MAKLSKPRSGPSPHVAIGNFISEQLSEREWKQSKLADEMGCTQGAISRLLAGSIDWDVDHILAAAKALSISPFKVLSAGVGGRSMNSEDLARLSDSGANLPPNLIEYLGAHDEDITKRERRWLERLATFANEPGTDTADFYDKLLKLFRERPPKSPEDDE